VAAAAPTLAVVFVGAGADGRGLPLVFVALNTLLQRRSPRELVGRVSAAVDITLASPRSSRWPSVPCWSCSSTTG
jgi:hypothetical protein